MIKFEINEFPFALTSDQFIKISHMILRAPELDYDIVEGDQGRGMVWLWAHHEVEEECENPTRYWIEVDGAVSNVEEVDWDWQGVGTPTPETTEAAVDKQVWAALSREYLPFSHLTTKVDVNASELRASLLRLEAEHKAALVYGRGWRRLTKVVPDA
jgi:hypothetical protein